MTHVRRPNRRHVPEFEDLVHGGICEPSGKVRFLDQRTAEFARSRLARRPADPDRDMLHVYPCGLCRDWHVGHDRSKAASDG
jgi:hypothetical protein